MHWCVRLTPLSARSEKRHDPIESSGSSVRITRSCPALTGGGGECARPAVNPPGARWASARSLRRTTTPRRSRVHMSLTSESRPSDEGFVAAVLASRPVLSVIRGFGWPCRASLRAFSGWRLWVQVLSLPSRRPYSCSTVFFSSPVRVAEATCAICLLQAIRCARQDSNLRPAD